MLERGHSTRIDDLAIVGEELSEVHLKLVAGAAKKKQAGPVRRNDGTCTTCGTYVYMPLGENSCEQDDDED
jgi:hypothetical protein